MPKGYNGLNSIKIEPQETFGLCPTCSRLLTAESCDHPTTMEIEEWRAIHFVAEQDLANESWVWENAPTDALVRAAYMEANDYVDLMATQEGARGVGLQ